MNVESSQIPQDELLAHTGTGVTTFCGSSQDSVPRQGGENEVTVPAGFGEVAKCPLSKLEHGAKVGDMQTGMEAGRVNGVVGTTSALTVAASEALEAAVIIPLSKLSVDGSFLQVGECSSDSKESHQDPEVAEKQEEAEAAAVPKLRPRRVTAVPVLASHELEAEVIIPFSNLSSDPSQTTEKASDPSRMDGLAEEQHNVVAFTGDPTMPHASDSLRNLVRGQSSESSPAPYSPSLVPGKETQHLIGADNAEGESEEEEPDSDSEEETSDSHGCTFYEDNDIEEEEEAEDSSYSQGEVVLKDEDVQELVDQLLKVESEAAEAQEMLEDESLETLKKEIEAELGESLSGEELNASVQEEITTYIEQWEEEYEDLQEQSCLLQEKLEDAFVSLPDLFKWIEKQAPEACTTQAWKHRTHWAGHQPTQETESLVKHAEEDLKVRHPLRSKRGKLLDEGASGFLERKLAAEEDDGAEGTSKPQSASDGGWSKVSEVLDNEEVPEPGMLMGTKRWRAVYLASTPEQAAQLGLALPGIDTVEEIGDIESERRTEFKAAIANEKECGLTKEQQNSIKKVREEDDVKRIRVMQKRPRKRFARQRRVKDSIQGRQAHIADVVYGRQPQPEMLIQQTPVLHSKDQSERQHHKWTTDREVDVIELLSDDEGTHDKGLELVADRVGTSEANVTEVRRDKTSIDQNVHLVSSEVQLDGNQNHEASVIEPGARQINFPFEGAILMESQRNMVLEAPVEVEEKLHSGIRSLLITPIQSALPDLLEHIAPVSPLPPVPLLELKRKRAQNETTLDGVDDENLSKRSKVLGATLEEYVQGSAHMMSSPDSGRVKDEGGQPTSLDTSTLYRTTVVIDSDGEREIEEAVTGTGPFPSSASRSPLSQRVSKSGRFRVEDTSPFSARDIIVNKLGTGGQSVDNTRKRKPISTAQKGPRDFPCTACGTALRKKDVLRHPKLPVGICKKCRKHYLSGPFRKDEDGSESECSWCGEGGEVVCCSRCDKVFCQACITRNFGANETNRIVSIDDWFCYFCKPTPLRLFQEQLIQAEAEARSAYIDIRGACPGENDQEGALKMSRKGKHRKNIRKVLEDDELEEGQKELLAREKERQERLEEWRSADDRSIFCPPGEKTKVVTAESYQDTSSRLLINVAREADEEAVKIAPSLAAVLKPHQIEGVRFMWENCIVSEKRVKEGVESFGCILAHSMGLGKTLQVITFIHTVLNRNLGLRTVLIVVPVNVLHNWRKEFDIWQRDVPNPVRVHILEELIRETSKRASFLSRWHEVGGVMLIGYAAFRNLSLGKHVRDKATRDSLCASLQNPGPDLLVCDEAHTIKNTKADITQVLKQVKTRRRVALTGSPLQNNLMEYYCMVDFVREGFLGSPQVFKNRFQNPIENGQHADSTPRDVRLMKQRAHVLHEELKGFVQRVNTNVLKDELPPKCVYVISVRLSPLQRQLYAHYLQFHGLLQNEDEVMEDKSQRKFLFNAYHALAKVWNHPDLLLIMEEQKTRKQEDVLDEVADDSDEEKLSDGDMGADDIPKGKTRVGNSHRQLKKKGSSEMDELEKPLWWRDIIKEDYIREEVQISGKMVLLLTLLEMSSLRGDKALVFSQSLATLDIIERFLQKRVLPGEARTSWQRDKHWYRLDGSTPAAARMQMCEWFNDPHNTAVKCVLISTRAGSLGINLPAANRVIIVDGSWNPTHDIQALFRAWRLGQKKPVYAYRLLAHGTMEEKIYSRQVAKEGVAARVLDEQQVGRLFAGDDLEFLFRLEEDGDDHVFEENESPQALPVVPALDSCNNSTFGAASVTSVALASTSRSKLLAFKVPFDAPPRDDVMGQLLLAYRPRWVVSYHEHEPLLEHREEENLSTEEQAAAWESYKMQGFPSLIPVVPCNRKDHAALLSEAHVPVGQSVECPICKKKMSWETFGNKLLPEGKERLALL